MLDEVGATKTVHQWERGITGFAVAFCGSPQSRCPCWLSLTCDNVCQLFQAQDERSPVIDVACHLQALNRQVSRQDIFMLACRRLREQGINARLALRVSQLLVPLQACFQQETRTRYVALAQCNLAEEAHKPARNPRIAHLIMHGEAFLQEGLSFCLIPLRPVGVS